MKVVVVTNIIQITFQRDFFSPLEKFCAAGHVGTSSRQKLISFNIGLALANHQVLHIPSVTSTDSCHARTKNTIFLPLFSNSFHSQH